jgi:O-antigen ligase
MNLQTISAVLLIAATAFAGLGGGAIEPGALLGLRLLTLFSSLAWCVYVIRSGTWQLPAKPVLWAALAWLVWAIVTLFFSPYLFAGLQTVSHMLLGVMAMILAAQLQAQQRTWLYTTLLWTAALMGCFGLLQALGFRPTPMFVPERVSSTYFNSNHYSGWLDVIIPLLAWYWLKNRTFGLIVLGLVLAINLALSFSWAAIAITVAVLWLVLRTAQRQVLRRVVIGGSTLLLVFAVLFAFSPQLSTGSLPSRVSQFFNQFVQVSLGTRLEVFKGNLAMIQDYPIVGVGPGNFPRAFPQYRAPVNKGDIISATTHFFVNYAHNDYLQIATEQGIPGMVLFIVLLVVALRQPTTEIGAKAALIALVIHGLVDANMTFIPGNGFLMWVMIGCIASQTQEPNQVFKTTSANT